MKQGAEKAHAGFNFDPGGTLSNFADENYSNVFSLMHSDQEFHPGNDHMTLWH